MQLSSTARFYDMMRLFYPLIDIFLAKKRRQLVEQVNRQSPGHLLEIGVGTGSHLKWYGSHEITGIDISTGMLRTAAKHARSTVRLVQMDGHDLLFADASFNYVVLSHVIAVVQNPDRVLEEVYRVLHPGGKCFILNHFTPLNGLAYVDRLFQPLGRLFHFRTSFRLDDMPSLKRFRLTAIATSGPFGYYKQLILEKQ
ncbi:MAG: class I SAM-dependent methyltransferase [Chitinophagaceae bacterium]|nr:MAG: class I SAM-dependent methyltransferase [Chitinophagaceae bacterium]